MMRKRFSVKKILAVGFAASLAFTNLSAYASEIGGAFDATVSEEKTGEEALEEAEDGDAKEAVEESLDETVAVEPEEIPVEHIEETEEVIEENVVAIEDIKELSLGETSEEEENVPEISLLSLSPVHNIVSGSIEIDGNVDDWGSVPSRTASGVDCWKIALSADESMLYLMYKGTAVSEWDYGFAGSQFALGVTFNEGSSANGNNMIYAVKDGDNGGVVKNAWYGNVPGSSCAIINTANHNTAGPYIVEMAVPTEYFGTKALAFNFKSSNSVSFGEIECINGINDAPEPMPVYTGITIDGSFVDWKAVTKYETGCPNPEHPNCISQAASVWDGDYLYIYIRDGKGSVATIAGSHSNGKFAIISDIGQETDIQLMNDGTVAGVSGVISSHVGDEWEIRIPDSELPHFNESIQLNYYLGANIVPSITNLQGKTNNSEFNGIVFDGLYEDWRDYPHKTIQYATPGSQEPQVDAKGALYWTDNRLYAHVTTAMAAHLNEGGGEFTNAVTVLFNSTQPSSDAYTPNSYTFAVRVFSADANGNTNWYPQKEGLPPGTYKYYIATTSELPFQSGKGNNAWGSSSNINNLNSHDTIYGEMIITVGINGKDEMEMVLYTDKIAEAIGCDPSELKSANAQFGRIGQQWISTAGTSSGPIVGALMGLAIASVGFYFYKRQRAGV